MTVTSTIQTHGRVSEIAQRFGVSRNTVYTWVRNHKLEAIRIGRTVLIDLEDLERLIASKRK